MLIMRYSSEVFFIALVAVLLEGVATDVNSNYVVTPLGQINELGEGPFWDEDAQLLLFVEMWKNTLVSYDPVSDKHVRVKIETDRTPVTFIVRVKGTKDRWVVGLKGALAVVKWNGKTTDPLTPKYFADVEDPEGTCRLNDAKCDPSNRLWAGTMGKIIATYPNRFEENKGTLFMIDSSGKVNKMDDRFEVSNGLDWNAEATKMYFIDSLDHKVFEYDFNNSDGSICNRKVIFDLKKGGFCEAMNSLPDGMTVDQEGMLWVAIYGTQKVIRIDPANSRKIFEITFPTALQMTSVAFGGKDMDILFVTSARVDWTEEYEMKYPESGKLFKVTGLGIKGTRSRDCYFEEHIWKNV